MFYVAGLPAPWKRLIDLQDTQNDHKSDSKLQCKTKRNLPLKRKNSKKYGSSVNVKLKSMRKVDSSMENLIMLENRRKCIQALIGDIGNNAICKERGKPKFKKTNSFRFTQKQKYNFKRI